MLRISLHSGSLRSTDLLQDVDLAHRLGYDGLEMTIPKIEQYLADVADPELDQLVTRLAPLPVTMIDVLMPIEVRDVDDRKRLVSICRRMAAVADRLRCPALQVVALDNFQQDSWPERRTSLVDSLQELSDITAPHGVRLAIEPVTFAPLRRLKQALDLIDRVGADRLGLVLDTWHLWTAGESWDDVAGLSPDLIVAAQLSDTCARAGDQWADSDRSVLPGDGILPLSEAVDAIRRTGFDGPWSVELFGNRYAAAAPEALAADILARTRALLAPLPTHH
jgi:sugar phosphate isomerase/epimerase